MGVRTREEEVPQRAVTHHGRGMAVMIRAATATATATGTVTGAGQRTQMAKVKPVDPKKMTKRRTKKMTKRRTKIEIAIGIVTEIRRTRRRTKKMTIIRNINIIVSTRTIRIRMAIIRN